MPSVGKTEGMSHSIQQRTIRTNGVDLVVTEAGDPNGP
jgi:hypothetical protein